MSIDSSVLIWTIINFLLLMLLLNRFLFRPLRSFMKARQEKIRAGEAAGEQARLQLSGADMRLQTRERQLRAEIRTLQQDHSAALPGARERARQQAEAQVAGELEAFREELKDREEELLQELLPDARSMALLLRERLLASAGADGEGQGDA